MRAWAALLAAAALAGCSGAPAAGPPALSPPAEEAALGLPAWSLRDFWTYTVEGNATTYVVTGEAGGDWILDTDSPERAFQDARDDISRLGPQRKSDLAGSQGPDRVEFFRWPLTDGKAWTTRWDRQPVTITVHLDAGLARLEAKDRNGTVAYRYTYDPEAGWFGELRRYARDGSEAIALVLAEAGHGWTGNAVRWDLQTVAKGAGDLATAHDDSGTYDVPLAATDVWVAVAISCSSGAFEAGTSPLASGFGTLDPRGQGLAALPCPFEGTFAGPAGPPKSPPQGGPSETWGWAVTSPPGGTGTYSFEILVRTLRPIPVG